MKRVTIYARKSLESDKDDSIKNQIAKCRDFVKSIYMIYTCVFMYKNQDFCPAEQESFYFPLIRLMLHV
jgi:hypothetical protein